MRIFKDDIILSEKQEEVLSSAPNSIIIGSAGTGKTLLAAKLAIKLHKENKSVCLIVYTKSLSSFIEGYLKDYPIKVFYEFEWFYKRYDSNFDVIIIDEFQDFSLKSIKEISLKSNNGIYLLGDLEQKLFDVDLYNNARTINEESLESLIQDNFKLIELKENFRIPKEKVEIVNLIFNEVNNSSNQINKTTTEGKHKLILNMIELVHLKKSIISNNIESEKTIVKNFKTEESESEWIVDFIKNSNYENIGILFPTNSAQIPILSKKLSENGIINGYKDKYNNTLSFRNPTNVNLITIHSSKGLEFDCVILPFLSSHNLIDKYQYLNQTNNLFYVAITRTKNQLVITYTDQAFEMLLKLKGFSKEFEIKEDTDNPIIFNDEAFNP